MEKYSKRKTQDITKELVNDSWDATELKVAHGSAQGANKISHTLFYLSLKHFESCLNPAKPPWDQA